MGASSQYRVELEMVDGCVTPHTAKVFFRNKELPNATVDVVECGPDRPGRVLIWLDGVQVSMVAPPKRKRRR